MRILLRLLTWPSDVPIYLHRQPVDFRKAINGLSAIVSEAMGLSPFDPAIFVFCNKRRTQLKVLYWDKAGFALWQKRLEQEKFKWPRKLTQDTLKIEMEQWEWLLRSFDYTQLTSHSALSFNHVV